MALNTNPSTTVRHCLACDKPLHGRSDKKFCNDYCRNAYNNSMKSMNNTVVRSINNVLTKNRKVLDNILGNEKTIKAKKEKLLQHGFNFRHITHTYRNKSGETYCFCYEMGYLPLENDWFLIVRGKEENAG